MFDRLHLTNFVQKAFHGRTEEQRAADKARAEMRDAASAQHVEHARKVWSQGNAADKALMMRDPVFVNQIKNDRTLAAEFGFPGGWREVDGVVGNLLAGDLGGLPYDEDSIVFRAWGGTPGMKPTGV